MSKVGEDFKLLCDLALAIRLNCLDLMDATKRLPSRPVWTDAEEDIIKSVEACLAAALDGIHQKQQLNYENERDANILCFNIKEAST